jgi:hypothetical protein
MTGCQKSSSSDGKVAGAAAGSANINISTKLSIADVGKVTLTVQSPTKLPTALNVPLVLKNGQYSAVVNNLVPATDYTFTADAKDKTTTTTSDFHGVASPVTITKGSTAQVTIYLNQVNAPGLNNSQPVIDTLSYSANQVAQGGTVSLTTTAHDPDAGQTASLSFVWTPAASCGTISLATATGGSDSADRTATATYTAPLANVDCQINLTVTDALGTSTSAAFSIRVGLGSTGVGSANVHAIVNGAPMISNLVSVPSVIALGSTMSTGLSVSATDPESDVMVYSWVSTTPGCVGVNFGAPTSATTSYSVASVTAGTTACTFTVTVSDSGWSTSTPPVINTVISSLTVPVAGTSPTTFGPPLFGLTYQSEATVADGDAVVLAAVASDPASGTITYTYSWAVDSTTGTSFVTATDAALGLDPIFTTAGTWTTPAGTAAASSATFTVRATSSVSHLFADYTFIFAPANNPCIGAADGTTCTNPANLCKLNATCVAGACVGTDKICAPSTTLCQDNVCAPSTGNCGLVPKSAGSACSDGNGCTTGDLCNAAGTCVTTPVSCPASTNVCLVAGACVSTGDATHTCPMTPAAVTTACSDNDPCTGNATSQDHCDGTAAGLCVAGGALCSAPQVCQTSGTPPVAACVTPACMNPFYGKQFTTPLNAVANAVDGSVWFAGQIFGPFDFTTYDPFCNPATDVNCLNTTGSGDAVLVKVDAATGAASVAKAFGQIAGGSSDQSIASVAVASSNNVGVIGSFTSEIDFSANDSVGTVTTANPDGNPGVGGVDYLSTTIGSGVNYYAILNGSGAPVAARTVDVGNGALQMAASNPNVDAIAICGKADKKVASYSAATTNGILTTAFTYASGMDIVVAKINAATGAVIWGRQFGGAGDQLCQSVTIDNNGDVIIAGGYNGTLQFGSLAAFTAISDPTVSALYVARLASADGTPVAATAWGTTGKVFANSVTVDGSTTAAGNIIVGGAYTTTIPFAGFSISSLGATDAFVAKLSTSGVTIVPTWALSYGDTAAQQGTGVATSSSGDVYFTGTFVGGMGSMGLTSYSATTSDVFVAHIKADGTLLSCVTKYGDAAGAQTATSITVARKATGALLDSVVIGGSFTNAITFGSSNLTTLGPSVSQYYFARLAP